VEFDRFCPSEVGEGEFVADEGVIDSMGNQSYGASGGTITDEHYLVMA